VEVVASNGLEAVRITTPVVCFFGLVLVLGGGIGLLTACCSELKFNPRLVNASFSHDDVDDVEEEERKVGLRTVDDDDDDDDDEEDTDLHVMIFLWNTKSFPDLESIGE